MNYLFTITDKFTNEIAGIYASLMPEERKKRFSACRDSLHKKQIVAAYMVLCYGLGRQYGEHNIRLKFEYSQTGKPYLASNKNIFFSISHSGNYVLCSIAEHDIGSDIQTMHSFTDSTTDFSVAESLLKLHDGRSDKRNDAVKTYLKRSDDYVIAVSCHDDVDNSIYEVRLDELMSYFSDHTTIGEYVRLNNSSDAFKVLQTPLEMFQRSVELYADREAVCFKGTSITYSRLDMYSNAIAHRLLETGVKTGDTVLLAVQPGIDYSIAEFAVMKAGATYVPVYKRWPLERVNYIIKECNISVALFGKEKLFFDCVAPVKLLCCGYCGGDYSAVHIDEKNNDINNIIYTSGSTGNPKGVMISKRGIASFSSDKKGCYYHDIVRSEYVRVACICPISFDMSVAENTTTLLNGGTVVFADDEEQYPINFGKFISDNNIDVVWATPSKFKMYLQSEVCHSSLKRLKRVVLAGEVLDYETARLSSSFPFELYNTYGPTETTIISTFYPVGNPQPNLPIGKPFANEYCYVLDNDGSLCEVGEKGELYISGECVAVGYKNNAAQTEENFLQNPFGRGRLYKTGDLVCLGSDGNLHFYGRKDNQVKINGFRVETEEVESAIYRITGDKTVVVCHEGRLVAFVESGNAQGNLTHRLKKILPDYMIPSHIIYVEKFPLNNNDKTDKKALLKLLENIVPAEYVAPQNDMQKRIAECWERFLNGVKVGIDDDFYSLGGDSICAMRIASELNQVGFNISMFDILNNKTVRNLSADIQSHDKEQIKLLIANPDPKDCADDKTIVPIDPYYEYQSNFNSQSNRCYVPLKMHKAIMQSTSSCNRIIYRVVGTTDKSAILSAVRKLIKNNPAFRTTYDRNKNQCMQVEYFENWNIPVLQISKLNKSFLDAVEKISLNGGQQYLSYIFVTEDGIGAIYIVLLLHWRFCDRAAMRLIKHQLTAALNDKKYYTAGITDPMQYAQFVRDGGVSLQGAIPETISANLSEFARLACDKILNKLLNGLDCVHFNCVVAFNDKLNSLYSNNPLNFVIELFANVLRNAYKLSKIPIYIVDQNRNMVNRDLVDTVIDFLPLVISDVKYDYYRCIKALKKVNYNNIHFIESGEWNTCDDLLPFVNYVAAWNEEEDGGIEIFDAVSYEIHEEYKHDSQISCSAFIQAGKLIISFSLPKNCKCCLIESVKEFLMN